MRLEFSLVARNGRRRELVVSADPALTVGRVLDSVVRPGDSVFLGAQALPADLPLSSGWLRSGITLSVGKPGPTAGWPLVEPSFVVLSGEAAGTIIPVGSGKPVIGRTGADLVVPDSTISVRHAQIEVGHAGFTIRDLDSTNGTYLEGRRLSRGEVAVVRAGQRMMLGRAVCELRAPSSPDGSLALESGEWRFNRVLRYRTKTPTVRIAMPPGPDEEKPRSSWPQYLSSVAMLATGSALSLVYGNWIFAAVGAIGPIITLGVAVVASRGSSRRTASQLRRATQAVAQARDEIAAAARAEADWAWQETLNPLDAQLAALGPTRQLWSTDAGDPSAMTVRIGTRDRPAAVEIQTAERGTEAPLLVAVPETIDLRLHTVLGLAGPQELVTGSCRTLIQQLVTTRSPDDLLVYFLAESAERAQWSWLRWLPHVHGGSGETHTVGASPEALRARLAELGALIDSRQNHLQLGDRTAMILPELVVILVGAGGLRANPGVVRVLKEGPSVGIRIIAIDEQPARLPVEATARLLVNGAQATLERRGADPIPGISPDLVSVEIAERMARALAPLRPLGGRLGSDLLPSSVRFTEVAGLSGSPSTAEVAAHWLRGPEGVGVVGVSEGGQMVAIDLVKDGPHALVAGSTGSGKSEFLRTWIAAMALSSSPTDLSLLLVDFKGGGAFGALRRLPHVVGYADDLTIGGRLAYRLLDSLKAELDYRKARFKAADQARDLEAYRKRRVNNPQLPSVARLVIVVDEFAQLKEELPDFVDGLVNVARIGRSLGVHLILATQQPAGVVSGQIRDNANLRVCLRVLDPGTSQDLVQTPVAATFANADKGRAVFTSGSGAAPLVFQAAYVSAPPKVAAGGAIPPPKVVELPWSSCGMAADHHHRVEEDPEIETDLTKLVSVLEATAREQGLVRARRPWLRPLPDLLTMDALGDLRGNAGLIPFAVADCPSEQRQALVGLRLGGGNVGIAGGRASGRSTALRTIAVAAALTTSPDDLHLHVIDQSPVPSLRSLSVLPHVGVVATRVDRYVTERLLSRLSAELSSRAALMAKHARHDFGALRAGLAEAAPPYLVVLVDGWDTIVQDALDGRSSTRDMILKLAEDGPPLGLQLVLGGQKSLTNPRLSSTFTDLLCLRFDQRDDMSHFDVPVRGIPEDLPPGRAYRAGSTDAIQIAVCSDQPEPDSQVSVLRRIAADLSQPSRSLPLRISELPSRLTLSEARMLTGASAGTREVLLGVGGDQLAPKTVALREMTSPFLIVGTPGMGRTEALVLICRQLLDQGERVLVYQSRTATSERFAGATFATAGSPVELDEETFLLADDAGDFDANDPLLLSACSRRFPRLCLAGDEKGLSGLVGWRGRLRAGADGLLLSPQPFDGDLIGLRVGRDEAFNGPPGRALLSTRHGVELIQLSLFGQS